MKYLLILYLAVIVNAVGIGQESFKLIGDIKNAPLNFTTDNLNQMYLVKNNQVFKLNLKGDTLYTFSDKRLGEITEIDVSNTLRPILFFKKNAQIIVTDNTLSAHQTSYNLEQLNLYQTQLVATSLIDNGIWIYDQELFQLIKVNTSFERMYESGNLEQLLQKDSLNPSQLLENRGKVYLVSPNHGILIFDIYASYISTIPIKDLDQIQVKNENIYYLKNGRYYMYDVINFEETEITIPLSSIENIRLEKNHLFIYSSGKISIYSIVKN